ncbi:putative cytokinetic ring protein SteA [Ornithinimicrobium faecis]|uniref:Cytokinetic ring protein SteA n=1 Tax=Ornithinimicrobium faecis TaxID=2934158 RepID=A0ABY4YPT6_9MICO|nr:MULTISPECIES: putative cytokinetic ring protein SteA [unclassified Ornithinimicrobium]USQ78378.1 putative cytokinetic ring protein SteA [Ornithinimicrobium sp. HY1793]
MSLSRSPVPEAVPDGPTVEGPIRVDARTKNLTKRLAHGDIAVINHKDLDQVSAYALVSCKPAAVVNAAASISGAYPNLGPKILVEAGVPLIDQAGEELLTQITEGATGRVVGDQVIVEGRLIAEGKRLDLAMVEEAMEHARGNISEQIEAFSRNTMQYVREERELLLDGIRLPEVRTELEGRYVLVVVRGYHYKEDLQTLRPFIREARPVLIGVDGGADALMELGYRPDIIVGDMDSVGDAALKSGAEIIVHAYRDGRAPGLERVEALGIEDAIALPAIGTSEDVAMLLADGKGAELIVAVGTHATLIEFLDKGRQGMASTFLTRLRLGSKLVDAKGVSLLYRSRISSAALTWLVLAGMLAVLAALAATPGGRTAMGVLAVRWDDLLALIGGLFG